MRRKWSKTLALLLAFALMSASLAVLAEEEGEVLEVAPLEWEAAPSDDEDRLLPAQTDSELPVSCDGEDPLPGEADAVPAPPEEMEPESSAPEPTGASADIPIDEAHFPNAIFRGYVSSRSVDANGDGALSEEERGNVFTISLERMGIDSLKGVELFPNLFTLFISNNELTSLDLSANRQLFQLSVDNNKLTSLDLSALPNLTLLSCCGNRLTALDVSRQPELSSLLCSDNQLTALDLSGNPTLRQVFAQGNALSSLSVKGLAKLEHLCCYGNRLTELDAGGCSALIGLFCDDNDLTSLKLNGCSRLTNLSCCGNALTGLDVSACPELIDLSCDDNRLDRLDLSGLEHLASLSCGDNDLKSLNVARCPALLRLLCDGNKLTALDVSHNGGLEWIYCRDNQLKSLDLSENRALLLLHCDDNELTDLDLSACPGLEAVWGKDNRLTNLKTAANSALRMLDLSGNSLLKLDLSNCPALRESLSAQPALENGNAFFGGRVSFSLTFGDGVQIMVSEKAKLRVRSFTRLYVDGKRVYGAAFPKKVTLNKSGTLILRLNRALTLKEKLNPKSAGAELTWASSRPKIATVDADGRVTPHRAGTTKITVATENGKKASVQIRVVRIKATGVKLNKKGTVRLRTGKTLQLKATMSPKHATDSLSWKSSRPEVAAVDEHGLVTALTAGTTVITVKTSGGRKAKVKIKVV